MVVPDLGFADQELDALRRRRFGFHYYGPDRNRLTEVVALYRWHDTIDVAVIRGPGITESIAYRVPVGMDVLDPERVEGYYVGNTAWALRWLITLEPPNNYARPKNSVPFPHGYGIPQVRRRPITIRPQG